MSDDKQPLVAVLSVVGKRILELEDHLRQLEEWKQQSDGYAFQTARDLKSEQARATRLEMERDRYRGQVAELRKLVPEEAQA